MFDKIEAKLCKNPFLKILWHITYANILALLFFLVNFFVFLFFAGMFEDYHDRYDYIQDLFLAIPVSTAFAFMLLRTTKKKNLVCDEELISDYEKRDYVSMKEDFKTVWKREWRYLLFIVVINILTFLLTNLDIMMMGKPTFTGVFTLYTPMRILSIAFSFSEIFGLVMATLYVCALYLLLVLRYRKKRYAVLEHDFRLAKYRGNIDKTNITKRDVPVE